MAKAGLVVWEKRMMEKAPSRDICLRKKKVVCVQFLSVRIFQWKNEAVEVNIQRHRLNIREKDMFNRT